MGIQRVVVAIAPHGWTPGPTALQGPERVRGACNAGLLEPLGNLRIGLLLELDAADIDTRSNS